MNRTRHKSGRRSDTSGRPPARANRSGRNPRQQYERYVTLARNAALSGDEIATENFYQHAEHYFRQMREG